MAHIEKYKREALGGMLGHYERWGSDAEKLDARTNIDPSLTKLNYNLGPERGCTQRKFIDARIAALGLKRKPRKDAVLMCDCVVTMPRSLDPSHQSDFFRSTYDFLAARYGEENVISAWVHLDEPDAQPHMHFAWVPVTEDGRLSAKDVCSRKDWKSLHQDMQAYLEGVMGCNVEVLLDEDKQGEKQLSHLSQKEYRAAKKVLRDTKKQVKDVQKQLEEENRRLERVRRSREAAEQRVSVLEAIAADCHAVDDAPAGSKVGLLGQLFGRCVGHLRAIAGQFTEAFTARLNAFLAPGPVSAPAVAQTVVLGAPERQGAPQHQREREASTTKQR